MIIPEVGYNGNSNLKRLNTPISFTQEQILEYAKCANDPIYFMETYCQIVSLDHGLIPFTMFDFQKEFVQLMHENRFVIGKMGRQMSKTTCVAAYILWYTIFNDRVTVGILAHKAAGSREVLARICDMYELLPQWLQHGVRIWNLGNIELENGSRIFTAATSPSAVRGKSCNLIYCDETAFVPNDMWEAFWSSTYPTISSGSTTKFIASSTPYGYNHFFNMWDGAIKGKNGFVPFHAEWQQHPNRDQKWADEQLKILGQVQYNQEVLCSFVGSSNTLVSGEKIASLPISDKIYSKDNLDILEYPIEGNAYVLIADTAKGVGGDSSAFTVIDVTTLPYKVVAKYKDNYISPMLYPNVIYKVATDYNTAYVLVEINSSEQVPVILYSELEYENVVLITKSRRGQEATSFGSGKTEFGINTDKRVKRIGCQTLKAMVEEDKLLVEDVDIIAELSTFIEKKTSYAADTGYHDDLVMTLVLFAWFTTQPMFKELSTFDLRQMMYANQMRAIEDSLTPFGFISDGLEEENEDGSVTLLNF